ncbi:MAG: anti-sigma factor family protein, partial [Burkholderiales bacterium]
MMDCRNYKELLDSYLSEELTVETNHAMLRHTEHCPACREELGARRELRQVLRRACSRDVMSQEATARLRAMLRAETPDEPVVKAESWWDRFSSLFTLRLALPVAAAALLTIGGLWAFYSLQNRPQEVDPNKETIARIELTGQLMDEAAGDHLTCAKKFAAATGPAKMSESVRAYDPAYLGLEQAAEPGAAGLTLRSAHVCGYGGRRFAHLVYTRGDQLISLLVTERDARALGIEALPKDDGSHLGLQHAVREQTALGAYQTNKHVVLVVSDLPEAENLALTERLGVPVAAHLRRVEAQSVGIFRIDRNESHPRSHTKGHEE